MTISTVDELYLREIVIQSSYAEEAWRAAQESLSSNQSGRFWIHLQTILISVGNVSKILWPSASGKHKERGSRLRHKLEILDDSMLKNRSFRNHFEHFDERLQKWFDSPRPAGFGDRNIGSTNVFNGGVNKPHWLRNYNPVEAELYFAGEAYNIKQLMVEIALVKTSAEKRKTS
jgi:hypothetical protein